MSGQAIALATKGILCCPGEIIYKIVTPININLKKLDPKFSIKQLDNEKLNLKMINPKINLRSQENKISLKKKDIKIYIKKCKE